MPGDKPDILSFRYHLRRGLFVRKFHDKKYVSGAKSHLKRKMLLGFSAMPIAFGHAAAQETNIQSFSQRFIQSLESTEILMLAVFGGAMSFALMSAIWLIRERSRIAKENAVLKDSLSSLRAEFDRNEALVRVSDQRIVVWNGVEESPRLLGSFSNDVGAPNDKETFLRFDEWLSPETLQEFEPLLRELRLNAKPFDTSLVSATGGVFEAQGRVSGSYAFVRIRELGAEREEHARIKAKHSALIEKFATLENLFHKLPIPIWLRNHDGKLSWLNQAYANALELEGTKGAIGTDWNLFDQEHREKMSAAQKADGFFQGTLPVTVAGDRKRLEVFSVTGEAGEAGIALDKSDVAEIRRTLEETNEGHSRMLDQLATAVAIFDKSQKLIFHNGGFQRLWKLDESFLESGPSNGELLDAMREGKLLPAHPDWRKWRDSQLEVYQAIEPREEWWHLMDGQTIRVIVTPRNQGGSFWVFENVTERLALESNYNSLMQVQGETLDHLNEAVAVFGSNGKLRLFNPALEALWNVAGIDVDEGLHIVKIIEAWTDTIANPDDLKKILGKATGLDDERSDLEGRLEMRNGCTFEYSLVPLPDGQSMLTLSDITANVNFEKALSERAEALEASDKLKSQFIQHVSYELRAPLTNISGFGEMLATPEIGQMNDKQAEYLSHINSSANELRAMVDDILDLASIDAGSMSLELSTVRLGDLVSDIFEYSKTAMAAKGLKSKVEISPQCLEIIADAGRLSQVLTNLVLNAINFSPDGGTITVVAKTTNTSNQICVIDQGAGVSEDQREAIFDRFETQPHNGARKGTGLGLSIARGFIEMHGGTVTVEDVQGSGACFTCRIPIEPKTGQEDANTADTVASVA